MSGKADDNRERKYLMQLPLFNVCMKIFKIQIHVNIFVS